MVDPGRGCPCDLQSEPICGVGVGGGLKAGAWWGQNTRYEVFPSTLLLNPGRFYTELYDTLIVSSAALGRTDPGQKNQECRIQPDAIQVLTETRGAAGTLSTFPNSFQETWNPKIFTRDSEGWLYEQISIFKSQRSWKQPRVLLSLQNGNTVESLRSLFIQQGIEQPYASWVYGEYAQSIVNPLAPPLKIGGLANIVFHYLRSMGFDGIDINYEDFGDMGDPNGTPDEQTVYKNWSIFLNDLSSKRLPLPNGDPGFLVYIQASPPGVYRMVKSYAHYSGYYNVFAPQLYNVTPGQVFGWPPPPPWAPPLFTKDSNNWYATTISWWRLFDRNRQSLYDIPNWFAYLLYVSNSLNVDLHRLAVAVPSSAGVAGEQPCWDYGHLATWMDRLSVIYETAAPLNPVYCDPRQNDPPQLCPGNPSPVACPNCGDPSCQCPPETQQLPRRGIVHAFTWSAGHEALDCNLAFPCFAFGKAFLKCELAAGLVAESIGQLPTNQLVAESIGQMPTNQLVAESIVRFSAARTNSIPNPYAAYGQCMGSNNVRVDNIQALTLDVEEGLIVTGLSDLQDIKATSISVPRIVVEDYNGAITQGVRATPEYLSACVSGNVSLMAGCGSQDLATVDIRGSNINIMSNGGDSPDGDLNVGATGNVNVSTGVHVAIEISGNKVAIGKSWLDAPIILDSDGTLIGDSGNSKIGFYGVTPQASQYSTIDDATDLPSAIAAVNHLLECQRKLGLIAS